MKPTLVVVTAILASAAASPTRADVLADFSSGATVTVGSATVDLGTGPRTSSGTRAVRKLPDSLDVTLSAADLGLALPITVHLRGALLRDGHIEYTIDDRYDPGVDLGAGERLQQLTGRLIMMATPVPGLATHADGNAWLRLVGPGSLDATGTWGQPNPAGANGLPRAVRRRGPAAAGGLPRSQPHDDLLGARAHHPDPRGHAD